MEQPEVDSLSVSSPGTKTQMYVSPQGERERLMAKLLEQADLKRFVWSRLSNSDDRSVLPPLGREENPGRVLIELTNARYADSRLGNQRDRLRSVYAELLDELVRSKDYTAPETIGELLLVATRTKSVAALDAMCRVVEDSETASLILSDGESLRNRAARSLVGLLGVRERDKIGGLVEERRIRAVLESCVREPPLAIFGLVGLLGLWWDERQVFTSNLPAEFVIDEILIAQNLALAGFKTLEWYDSVVDGNVAIFASR